jgi:hypothetical protein
MFFGVLASFLYAGCSKIMNSNHSALHKTTIYDFSQHFWYWFTEHMYKILFCLRDLLRICNKRTNLAKAIVVAEAAKFRVC